MKSSKVGAKSSAQAGVDPQDAEPTLGHDIRAKIGRQLRAMYDDVVRQGVPERFVELLDRLGGMEKDRD
jgi:hypothetical protein